MPLQAATEIQCCC